MSEELDSLRAEVAALRAELAEQRGQAPGIVTRRRLLTGLLGAGAAGAAGIATAPSANAANGDPLFIGENNDATNETFLTATYATSETRVILASEPWGVYASAESIGVLAKGQHAGVWGEGNGPTGSGVTGHARDAGGIGVIAVSKAGPAVAAQSDLDGVTLELIPAARTGPPTSMPAGLTEYRIGSVSVDEAGELWFCTAAGAPGTWTRLLREDTATGRVVPIAPIRALDTRATAGRPSGSPAIPGQKKGPLHGQESLTLDLAGVDPIPTTAAGVLGNLTVINPDYSGHLVAVPSGGSSSTSALNFVAGDVVANAFTSALGPDGLTLRANGSSGRSYHLVVDITAYIT